MSKYIFKDFMHDMSLQADCSSDIIGVFRQIFILPTDRFTQDIVAIVVCRKLITLDLLTSMYLNPLWV